MYSDWCTLPACSQVHAEASKIHLYRARSKLWPQLGGEEVRVPSSKLVSAGIADTMAVSPGTVDSAVVSEGMADSAAVEALTVTPAPGVQKSPRWVGKRFWDRFAAAPLLKAWRIRRAQTIPA
jgi:hypothetical protein